MARRHLNRKGKLAVFWLLFILLALFAAYLIWLFFGGHFKGGSDPSADSLGSTAPSEGIEPSGEPSLPPEQSKATEDAGSPEGSEGPEEPSQPESEEPSEPEESGGEEESSQPVTANPDDAWQLVLINWENPMPDPDYVPELAQADSRGYLFDARAVEALKEMLAAAQAEGLSPILCSTYRTWEKQTTLFNNQVARNENRGMGREEAVEKAKTVVAYPGTSEHQMGLAADIVALSYQILDEGQLDTPEQQWLIEHCAEYGFILRYPDGKSDLTGVIFEPWHYRYVGKEAAQAIMSQGICLEEYLSAP